MIKEKLPLLLHLSRAFLTNPGFLYAVAHVVIFATTTFESIIVASFSLILCFLSILFRLKGFAKGKVLQLFQHENAPLFITGIALVVNAINSFSNDYMIQAFVGLGFGLGNLIKAIELTIESRKRIFLQNRLFLKTILRPELMHAMANIRVNLLYKQ